MIDAQLVASGKVIVGDGAVVERASAHLRTRDRAPADVRSRNLRPRQRRPRDLGVGDRAVREGAVRDGGPITVGAGERRPRVVARSGDVGLCLNREHGQQESREEQDWAGLHRVGSVGVAG